MTTKTKKPKLESWDYAVSFPLRRCSPCGLYDEELDRGVNFFVLMLEQLGATTEYSCEGHPYENEPGQFYIVFNAPLKLARAIQACGYFRVEIERLGRWSLRTEIEFPGRNYDYRLLKMAARAWEKNFGPLKRSRKLFGFNARRQNEVSRVTAKSTRVGR